MSVGVLSFCYEEGLCEGGLCEGGARAHQSREAPCLLSQDGACPSHSPSFDRRFPKFIQKEWAVVLDSAAHWLPSPVGSSEQIVEAVPAHNQLAGDQDDRRGTRPPANQWSRQSRTRFWWAVATLTITPTTTHSGDEWPQNAGDVVNVVHSPPATPAGPNRVHVLSAVQVV